MHNEVVFFNNSPQPGKAPTPDENDTISSSDGAFHPPALSQYAKELLSDKQVAAQAAAAARTSDIRARVLHKRVSFGEEEEEYDDEKEEEGTTCIYSKSPIRNFSNSSRGFPRTGRFAYSPSSPHLQHTYTSNSQASSSSSSSGSPNTHFGQHTHTNNSDSNNNSNNNSSSSNNNNAFATPAISRASSSNRVCESTARSSRVKRLGKGMNLGPPKRTVRDEKEMKGEPHDLAVKTPDNKPPKIRFASKPQEIPSYQEEQREGNAKESSPSSGSSSSDSGQDDRKPRSILSTISPNLNEDAQAKAQAQRRNKNAINVNGRDYQKLEMIGRGGSSKVYKVQANNGKTMALKKVSFQDIDNEVIDGFKGEIKLLNKLREESRVVKLVDYEMLETSVYLVMECGEIDLAHVLAARLNDSLDISFVRYYSVEMLKCVKAVHDHGIVHSDLKPANFLLVKGMLKIIDFGIANVVPEYTANVHRETQIGTPNYMAPEALVDSNSAHPESGAKFKVGRPSDVWSCGCIMYQMIYGKPPYAGYSGPQRMMAIMNPNIDIQYPRHGLGSVKVPKEAVECIQGCLDRDPTERSTIGQALSGQFLNPQTVDKSFVKNLIEHAVQYGVERHQPVEGNELNALADDVWKRIQALNI